MTDITGIWVLLRQASHVNVVCMTNGTCVCEKDGVYVRHASHVHGARPT